MISIRAPKVSTDLTKERNSRLLTRFVTVTTGTISLKKGPHLFPILISGICDTGHVYTNQYGSNRKK
jgi:hypothetical protein